MSRRLKSKVKNLAPPKSAPEADPSKCDQESPCEWEPTAAAFSIPEFESLGLNAISAPTLSRHVLITGETGSGKTQSGILPILRAAIQYKQGTSLAPAGLVIDPKHELRHIITRIMPDRDRLIVFDNHRSERKLHMFEGQSMMDSRFGKAEYIVQRICSLSRYAMAERTARDPFWFQQASLCVRSLVAVDLEVFRAGGPANLAEFWDSVRDSVKDAIDSQARQRSSHASTYHAAWERMREAMKRYEQVPCSKSHEGRREIILKEWLQLQFSEGSDERGQSYNQLMLLIGVAIIDMQSPSPLRTALVSAQTIGQKLRKIGNVLGQPCPEGNAADVLNYDRENYFAAIKHLLLLGAAYSEDKAQNPVIAAYQNAAAAIGVLPGSIGSLLNSASQARATFASVVAVACNLLEEFTSPAICSALSLNPFEPPESALSVQETIESGKWLVCAPASESPASDTIGRALKSKFFQFIFRRKNRARPFFYIADEFHRYITNDPESGEQNLLDRCRAFRSVCVLATQSVASLRNALATSAYSDSSDAAIAILVNNTGTKLFFRTTDSKTESTLKSLLPVPPVPGRSHVLDVRPASTLALGECYFVAADGRWGRGQVTLKR